MKTDRHSGIDALLCMLIVGLAGLSGCSGNAGSDSSTGKVDRSPATSPDGSSPESGGASVSLTATESAVPSGGSVQLSWTSDRASSCQASGGWGGAQPTEGSAVVGPLTRSTTFSLTCTGADGNAMAMLSVGIIGTITLTWQGPTENVDGTPLADLSRYRIYYGSYSRAYTDQVDVPSPTATRHDVVLASGSYYFAMTAINAEGDESGYSNEVIRTLN